VNRDETEIKFQEVMMRIDAALSDIVGENDKHFLTQRIVGKILLDTSYSKNDLGCNNVGWSLDEYVAAKIGPLWPRMMRLHQHLVQSGATPNKPFNFEHCDRYGVSFADEEKWKSMALMTQNYTYVVVLQRYNSYDLTTGDVIENWAMHFRICTKSQYSRDWTRESFKKLEFLSSFESVYPEIGYGDKAHNYFRYKDGRDQGYLCSVEPSIHDPYKYSTKDVLVNYGLLASVIYDLASHCDCLDE